MVYYSTWAGLTCAGQISYISGRLASARRKSASRYAHFASSSRGCVVIRIESAHRLILSSVSQINLHKDMKYLYGLLVSAFVIFSVTEDASAQSRKGFEVGLGPSLLVASGDGESDSGFGAHLTLAYGIGERFTIGLNGAAGIISDDEADDDVTASVGGLFGRLYFGAPENLGRPYFTFGGGQGSLEAEFTGISVEVSGPAGMVGIGFDYMRPDSKLGFFGELNYNIVNFEEVSVGGITVDGFDVDVDYIVFAAGIRLRLQ